MVAAGDILLLSSPRAEVGDTQSRPDNPAPIHGRGAAAQAIGVLHGKLSEGNFSAHRRPQCIANRLPADNPNHPGGHPLKDSFRGEWRCRFKPRCRGKICHD